MAEKFTPEQRLWRAVIAQAIEDALPLSGFSKNQYHQQKAWAWFYRNSTDYKMVCLNAGIDSQKLRRTLIEKVHPSTFIQKGENYDK